MRSKRSVCLMKSGYLGWSTLIGRRKFKARELNRRRAKPTPPALFMLLVASATLLAAVQPVRVKLGEKWNFSSPSPFSPERRRTRRTRWIFFFFKYQDCILFFSLDSCMYISISCKELNWRRLKRNLYLSCMLYYVTKMRIYYWNLYLLIIIHRGI